ncbi:anthranilate synthase component I [Croceicoccus sp. F390]|uniref:Anthranilate synthase component 1 n=1 Tax=Croceicoccus esteveae TaxID=3075597 RepID=A0ABU2ZFV8_9SPHN|nr:anthranilate synthase component I [Croceicoccus sp. F390]MDT0575480.1 anthranilate synthase component I [Croceicoccus sp. F390]
MDSGQAGVVWRRVIADCETPVSAALKLMVEGRGDFLLESVEGGETRGRYSLVGIDPDLVFRASGNTAWVNAQWQQDADAFEVASGDPLQSLRALAAQCRYDVPDPLPPALSSLVGYLGYETIGLVEKIERPEANPLELPDMLFVRPTLVLVFDSLKADMFCIAPLWPGSGNTASALVADAAERIDSCLARLGGTLVRDAVAGMACAPLADGSLPEPLPDPFATPCLPSGEYHRMVDRAKDYILAGDIFQVVLAQRFTAPFPLPPLSLYRALRRINPSPFLYFLDLPGFSLIGSSPEILVRVRDGEVTIRPIAGTRPRGRTPAADEVNRASLLADPKERAEHLMLLDLGRNDTGRVAAAGSVRVTDSYSVEKYSHVMHIVSNVTGTLRSGLDAVDALLAGFPAGTVSGAPKVRACQIIAELENETRGAYAGGVGYFAPDGSVDSCIVLRTAVVKDGVMHVQSGAGIVADSTPEYEQQECEAKAGALFAAAREAVRLASLTGFGQ